MSALDITLSPEEKAELKRLVRSATLPQREGRRARIILLAAEGETRDNIARLTGFSCPTILAPPDKALVLCCDEKSQVLALERTQQGLPLGICHIQTKSHDYTRHGTVTLFAALDYLQGKLISSIERQHRHQEWLAFLKKINKETPKHLQPHLIVDHYATHKHAAVKAWLAKHPRFHIHFTPTSSSWMNMVERFFRDVTVYLRDGSFTSVREL